MSTHTVLSWASTHAWVFAAQAANNGGRAVALRGALKIEWSPCKMPQFKVV